MCHSAHPTHAGVTAPPTRGVPDVSLDADPESGYDVVVDGTVEGIGGTSASAPSWQGIWARVNGAHAGLGSSADLPIPPRARVTVRARTVAARSTTDVRKATAPRKLNSSKRKRKSNKQRG